MSIQAPNWLYSPALFSRYKNITMMYFEWLNCKGEWYLGKPGAVINQVVKLDGYTMIADVCVIYITGHFLYRYVYTEESLKFALKELNNQYHAAYNRAQRYAVENNIDAAIAEYKLDIKLRHLSNALHALYNVVYPHLKLTSPRSMKRHIDAIRFLEEKVQKIL